MQKAMTETNRRRQIQEKYNKQHNIIPKTIIKEIHDAISNVEKIETKTSEKLSKKEVNDLIINIEKEMKVAAANLDFERAMELRDILFELKSDKNI